MGLQRPPCGVQQPPRRAAGTDRPRPLVPPPAEAQQVISATEIEQIVLFVLADDTVQIARRFDAMLAAGMAVEAIYLGPLSAVAHRLGDLWVEDRCSFTQVAMGVMHLQTTLRRLSGTQPVNERMADPLLRALLMPAPNEQHSFGLVVVAEFFRRAGWQVDLTAALTDHELSTRVGGTWFATAALSLAADRHIAALATRIRLLRAESRNRDIAILVGGPVFLARPGLAVELGADGTAPDARQAVRAAFRLLDRRTAAGRRA